MSTSDRPAHLGIYCPGAGTGGPWRYVHSILAAIDPNEFDVTVFCDLPGVYEQRPCVKVISLGGPISHAGGAPVVVLRESVPATHSRLARLAPKAVRICTGFGRETRRLARLLRQHPLDLFHTQSAGCEESSVAARLAGVPMILGTFHVDSTYDLHRTRSSPTYRLLEFISNRSLDAAISVSHATKRDWVQRSRIPATRVVTIHNGIDPEKFRRRMCRESARRTLGLPEQGLIIGGLGRLDEAKGFRFLIEAAALLRPEFPNLAIVVAGEGALRGSLELQVEQLGLSSVVRFLGFQSDVQEVLDALDVFVMPSLCEALPFALLEAMATELSTVGSTVGGIPEVIVSGETGFIVPPRDSGALAQSLRALLNDAELRARMGAAGRVRVVRDFQERDMVRKTIEIYRSAINSRKRARGAAS